MNLKKKKALIARTLEVGKGRIRFNTGRLPEIKEALTKQDVRDLLQSGAIRVNEIHGRKAVVRRKSRRKQGSVRKKIKSGKRGYIIITRKLRSYLADLRRKGQVSDEHYIKLRKEIRARNHSTKARFKERIAQLK